MARFRSTATRDSGRSSSRNNDRTVAPSATARSSPLTTISNASRPSEEEIPVALEHARDLAIELRQERGPFQFLPAVSHGGDALLPQRVVLRGDCEFGQREQRVGHAEMADGTVHRHLREGVPRAVPPVTTGAQGGEIPSGEHPPDDFLKPPGVVHPEPPG